MAWPQATDYNAAIQNPQLCFADLDLRQGQAEGDLFGLPRPHSGNFADVYQVRCPDSQLWAVKCFTRPLAERGAVLRRRYQAISEYLRHRQPPFMVDFHYLEEGICVAGQWYPLLKMRWVEGQRFNDFLAEHGDKTAVLDRLMHLWLRLAHELREAGIGHGDLQHGNVMLVPGSRAAALALRLIDYDGLSVPALAGTPSGEVGHPNYQHPQRRQHDLPGPDVDRFAHLVVYTSLRALRAAGPELWRRHDGGENLLFREDDFLHPAQSRLLAELAGLPDPDLQQLLGHLVLASQGPLSRVPFLGDLVHDQAVRPLSPPERQRLAQLIPLPARKSRLVLTPATPSPAPPPRLPGRDTDPGRPAVPTMLFQPAWRPPTSAPATAPALAQEPSDQRAPLLTRPLWLAGIGFAVIACLLLASWLLRAPAGHEQPQAPSAARVELDALPDITFEGGHQRSILIKLSRNGCPDELAVRAEGLPAGVRQEACVLAADREEAHLVLAAATSAECPPRPLAIVVWQGDVRVAEQELQLTVTRFHPPRLGDLDPIRLEQRETRLLRLAVQREGYTGSLRIEVNDLPPGVSQRCYPAADGASTITVELTASENARPITAHFVRFQLWADRDRIGDPIPVVFNLEEHHPRPRVLVKGPLRLAPGATEGLTVQLDRLGFPGPVRVRLEGLPRGVSAEPVIIRNGLFTSLPVRAAAGVGLGSHKARVLALVGEEKVSECELVVNIERPEPMPPPAQVEKPRGKGEKVTFSTVDHALLRGTYYRGSKGKKSGCVLLVHDLKRSSADESWRKLALQLHARGHTVLAFDLRGHGGSTRVEPAFWKEQVNHVIRGYRQGAALEVQPREIKYDDFPAGYYVWLLHDLAAARTFLEDKHDTEDEPVNMKNVVVIGAGQGATLSAVWLETEAYRHRIHSPEHPLRFERPAESEILTGAIWIGLEPALMGRNVQLNLMDAGQQARLPMVLLYGGNDEIARDSLEKIFKLIRENTRVGSDLQAIPGTAEFRQHLLDREPRTADLVCEAVDRLLGIRFETPWMRRHVSTSSYDWVIPGRTSLYHLPAKSSVERQLRFVPLRYFNNIRVDGQPIASPRNPVP